MNWGHKIMLVYGSFAAFIISLVVFCARQTDIFLVSPDYYKEEIAYQRQIDQLSNAGQLKERMQVQYISDRKMVELRFPTTGRITGEVLLFRPSDARKDISVAVQTDAEGRQTVPVAQLQKGLWKVKVHWQEGSKEYLKEETLVIQ
jgi:hypothetical protein